MKLTKNNPNKKLINKAIEAQLLMMAPFTPFICEETWNKIGKKDVISISEWPECDEGKIDKRIMYMEEIIDNTRKDIYAVLKLLKIDKPRKIRLFVAELWKYEFMDELKKEVSRTKYSEEIIKKLMATNLKKYGNEISKLVPQLIKNNSKIPAFVLGQKVELNLMREAAELYKEEMKVDIEVIAAEKSSEIKAKQSLPGKVAILVE